jgi:formylglycine-generating enzyme required for sulfatase activity
VLEFVAVSRRAVHRRRRNLIAILVGAVCAVPLISALVWAGFEWWGVRSVERDFASVRAPAGCFEMGSPDSDPERYPNEGPVHRVCLKPFDLGKFEVTEGEWRKVMLHNPHPSQYEGDNRPVDNVSWDDAQTFVHLMSFFGQHEYRLPTEAEWEYAARAGTTTSRYWGDRAQDGCAYENMMDQSLRGALNGTTARVSDPLFVSCDAMQSSIMPVGSFKPNPFGLYDMLGNAAEWVEDCYSPDYTTARGDGQPVSTTDCGGRVIRGGSWIKFPRNLRAANRVSALSDFRSYLIGFRLARSVAP